MALPLRATRLTTSPHSLSYAANLRRLVGKTRSEVLRRRASTSTHLLHAHRRDVQKRLACMLDSDLLSRLVNDVHQAAAQSELALEVIHLLHGRHLLRGRGARW